MRTVDIILQQLGGGKFVAMTGCNNFISRDNGKTLQMNIPRNHSKANRLWITLNSDDTYTMRFFRYTSCRFNTRTMKMYPEKITEVKTFEHIFFDQLQELFTEVTWMYTHL